MSVKLIPHYQHCSIFMRVSTSFATVLEFLIGVKKFSGLLIHKNAITENIANQNVHNFFQNIIFESYKSSV